MAGLDNPEIRGNAGGGVGKEAAAWVDSRVRGGHLCGEVSVVAKKPPREPVCVPVFPIACAVLGVVAFAELLVAGLALAARMGAGRQVEVVEREVIKWVERPAVAGGVGEAVVTRPPVPEMVAAAVPMAVALPAPTPMQPPAVADPRTEQLVVEAREARMRGDMGLAIVKLDEAAGRSPNEPNVQYELGLVHEAMGVYDTAADHYEKVAQLGVSGAGALYQKAMDKLGAGLVPEVPVGKLVLGRVRVYKDPEHEGGQRVILTVPVQKAADMELDLSKMRVWVEFFNRSTRDGVVPLQDKSWVSDQWVSEPCDWVDGEETLRVTYTLPGLDTANEHLFGQLEYHGQVVSLIYDGEVVDLQAWPPNLAAKSQLKAAEPQPQLAPEILEDPNLPLDFNPELPAVLPPR